MGPFDFSVSKYHVIVQRNAATLTHSSSSQDPTRPRADRSPRASHSKWRKISDIRHPVANAKRTTARKMHRQVRHPAVCLLSRQKPDPALRFREHSHLSAPVAASSNPGARHSTSDARFPRARLMVAFATLSRSRRSRIKGQNRIHVDLVQPLAPQDTGPTCADGRRRPQSSAYRQIPPNSARPHPANCAEDWKPLIGRGFVRLRLEAN